MKQILVKSGKICVEEVPAPALERGMVLVRVRRSVISSGTESEFVSGGGTASFLMENARNPANLEKVKRKLATIGVRGTVELVRNRLFHLNPLGYSSAGVVAECGGEAGGYAPGDRVACAGFGHAVHAEYNAVPHALVTPIPEELSDNDAAFVTVGAIALQSLRRARPELGEIFLVFGLGLIGLLTVQLLRAAGCRVIGVDPVAERRVLAETLGAAAVCAPEEAKGMVADRTAGVGVDGAIVCAASKSSTVTNQAVDLCRKKGRVVVTGQVGLELTRAPLYEKEVDFMLSCSYGPGRYDRNYEEKGLDYPIGHVRWTQGRNMAEFLHLLAEGRVAVAPLVSGVFVPEEAEAAYEKVGKGGAVTALFRYDTDAPDTAPRRVSVFRAAAAEKECGIAVIGAGAFATSTHLPNLSRMAGCGIVAVVNRNGMRAKQIAERYHAEVCATDHREVLENPRVRAVVITTRHNLHAPMALDAIAAGKHVFVEKPLALTLEDCGRIRDAAAEKGVLVTVGFNRRFAPLAVAVKAAWAGMTGPKMLLYRCNAGPLPGDHWTLDPEEGGGRILGEAVHFFDFARWMVDSEPVSVQSCMTGRESIQPQEDNMGVLVRFANGSTATIVYTSLGHPGMAKERIEGFCGGGCFELDDFVSLRFHGMRGKDVRGTAQDKGHFGVMEQFVNAVRGAGELRVTADDGLAATRMALDAMRLLKGDAP